MRISQEGEFWAEGRARAKALRWDCDMHLQRTVRKPVAEAERGQEEGSVRMSTEW